MTSGSDVERISGKYVNYMVFWGPVGCKELYEISLDFWVQTYAILL